VEEKASFLLPTTGSASHYFAALVINLLLLVALFGQAKGELTSLDRKQKRLSRWNINFQRNAHAELAIVEEMDSPHKLNNPFRRARLGSVECESFFKGSRLKIARL